jgi:uncharacterized lipoprotein
MMTVVRYCLALTPPPRRLPGLLPGLLLALTLLGACSSDARKREYVEAIETPSLEIPEGMARPSSGTALVIGTPPIPLSPMAMETRPPRISSTTSGLDANSQFSWSPEGLYLLVDDEAESVHRRLGLVIERAGMQRIRLDDQGVYRFDYYQTFEEKDGFFRKMAFWSRDKGEDYSGAYQVFTRPDGERTRVFLKYADGTDCEPDAAEHVLDFIRSRLG